MLGQPANLKNERKEFRPKVAKHSQLGRTTECEPRNNTGLVLFSTPAPHPPASPTSALAGNHTGVLSKPTLPNTRQPPMLTYTSVPRSEEGWIKVVEDRVDQGGMKEGVSLKGSKSKLKEWLKNKRRAENSNPNFVPDLKRSDGAKAPGRSQNTGTATILGRKLLRRPFQFLKKGPHRPD